MEKKYISENRYRKSTIKKRRNIDTIKKSNNSSKNTRKTAVKKVKKARVKPSIRKERRITRINIFTCIILLILIAIILRAMLKEEGEPFIPIFFGTEENIQVISVGIITDENLLNNNTNNVVLKELRHYSNHMLLTINSDYSLNYDAISNIGKISELEYEISINKSKEYDANSIKNILDEYKDDKKSVYYEKLKNIKNINTINQQTLKITLIEDNPYFAYNLDIPICKTSKKQYEITANSTSASLEFERTKYSSEEAPAKIIVKKYKDMYEAVEAYKKGIINMLVTNQKNVQNMLGKYEYNIKTYRTGETIFLFLNNKSTWLKNEELRKVIAYSIDRESIVKNVMQSAANIIDLPYIYDEVRYKYDIYAAENLLLSNNYKKSNKIYSKNNKQVVLSLIVNKEDTEKVEVAKCIKNNLSSIGIKVNVEQLSNANMSKRIQSGNYDLLLGNINLNNNPDIAFLNNTMYMTDKLETSLNELKTEADLNNISQRINNISNAMSNVISYVGITAKTSYVVYSKEIIGIKDISYLNIFRSMIII